MSETKQKGRGIGNWDDLGDCPNCGGSLKEVKWKGEVYTECMKCQQPYPINGPEDLSDVEVITSESEATDIYDDKWDIIKEDMKCPYCGAPVDFQCLDTDLNKLIYTCRSYGAGGCEFMMLLEPAPVENDVVRRCPDTSCNGEMYLKNRFKDDYAEWVCKDCGKSRILVLNGDNKYPIRCDTCEGSAFHVRVNDLTGETMFLCDDCGTETYLVDVKHDLGLYHEETFEDVEYKFVPDGKGGGEWVKVDDAISDEQQYAQSLLGYFGNEVYNAKTKNDASVFDSGISVCEPEVVVPRELEIICESIQKRVNRREFSIIVKGHWENGKFVLSTDYYIPKQETTGTHIDYKEDLAAKKDEGYNTVIHSHPFAGSRHTTFSKNDHDFINSNFDYSLLYTQDGFAEAIINFMPDNLHKVQVNADVTVVREDSDIEIDVSKIKKKQYQSSYKKRQGRKPQYSHGNRVNQCGNWHPKSPGQAVAYGIPPGVAY